MGPFIFLDIESTGVDASRDHIIEIAALKWEDFTVSSRWQSLINPRVPVPREITMLTGIIDEDVTGAPVFSEIKETLTDFVSDMPIVGHNIAFDTSFIRSHHLALNNPEIDTVQLARILLRKESSYALEVLMKKHGLPLRGSHRAMADVETTVSFFEFLLGKIDEIPVEAKKILREILEKSSWGGKPVFQNIL